MDCFFGECEGKKAQDPSLARAGADADGERCVMVEGPLIVGGGPSGLAVAACLKMLNITYTMLERSNCLVPLWQNWTYDRLKLHLPKQFCELPFMPFPRSYPTYPNKKQFLRYIASYSKKFGIHPVFGTTVVSAEHDGQFWVVQTCRKDGLPGVTYRSQWLVVATGENAEPFMPEIEGMRKFHGDVFHTSAYRNGNNYVGKKVLVVGSGNSGMEVALDLANHNARPYMVVRDKVHVMPREMMGLSTFGLSMWLLRWLPIQAVDRLLLLLCRLVIGDTASLGITRPAIGPLQLKAISGKTPVLDVGTLDKIRSGDIKVLPAMNRLLEHGAEFIDGRSMDFDAVILATGYRSNVPLWLKEKEFFSEEDGFPRKPSSNGWKGKHGLYAVGFTRKGLLGSSIDAMKVANDIAQCWKSMTSPPSNDEMKLS